MSTLNGTHAPYNFVPFHSTGGGEDRGPGTERVCVRYDSPADLPRHDVFYPDLLTGEIQVTMKAETPVFVSDGNRKKSGGRDGADRPESHFFRGPDGALMIPGSTVRGMTRENMQILGFGIVRMDEDMKDYQIYFRDMTSSSTSVNSDLKAYYNKALGIKPKKDQNQKSFSVPQSVKAGYLHREGNHFYIQPVLGGTHIRVPRKNRALNEAGLVEGEAQVVDVSYQLMGNEVSAIRRGTVPGWKQGKLLYTGKGIGKPGGRDRNGKPKTENARYLFPEEDPDAVTITISNEDRISYQEDYENRSNVLGEKRNFWKLPESGESKPVFYTEFEGHVYFGMTLFLRIGYKYPLSLGMPAPADPRDGDHTPLDYIHAMLGYAEKNEAYRSRVYFGDFRAQEDPKTHRMPAEMAPVTTVLGGPKPSWFPGYVVKGKNYNEDGFTLRGFKLYWLQEKPWAPPLKEGKEKVGSTLRPLPTGTAFKGTIRFRNLHPDELGLLLWSLRLDDGCFQSMGMGKPYGYGRMTLSIDRLLTWDPGAIYSPEGLCAKPTEKGADEVDRFIQEYDAYVCEKLGYHSPTKAAKGGKSKKKKQQAQQPQAKGKDSIRTMPIIQDFFFMRSTIMKNGKGEEASYMDLDQGEFKNLTSPLPTVRDFRKAASGGGSGTSKGSGGGSGSGGGQSMEDMLAALANRWNR